MSEDEEKRYFETNDIRQLVKEIFKSKESRLELAGFDIAAGLHEPYAEDITFYFTQKQSIRKTFADPVTGTGGRVDKDYYSLTIYTADGVTEKELEDIVTTFVKKQG